MNEKPKITIELPDGDKRSARIVWSETKPDGTLALCIIVEDDPALVQLRAKHAELLEQLSACRTAADVAQAAFEKLLQTARAE